MFWSNNSKLDIDLEMGVLWLINVYVPVTPTCKLQLFDSLTSSKCFITRCRSLSLQDFHPILHFCRFANSEAVHVLFRWVCGWPCWVVLNTVLLLLVFVRWYSVFCTKWFGLDLVEQGKERKWKASMKLVLNSNWWRNPRKKFWFYKNGFNQMHRKIVETF